jgi:putative FmdB family regulatory protein
MPIYEYACGACGHQFEEWQKMSDPPVRTCPKCKKKKVEKLISQTSFTLKGGGWYSDLYSNKPAAKAASGDSGGDSSPAKDVSAKDTAKDSSTKESTKESKKDSKPADAKPAKKAKAGGS